jgi:Spy/CpxP family protein refolding chaperone
MLTEKLKLTAEQQEKLADIRKTEAEQLKAVRGDRTKMADVTKTGRAQVRAILTPEQQKEFDAIKPEGRPARKGKKARGDT